MLNPLRTITLGDWDKEEPQSCSLNTLTCKKFGCQRGSRSHSSRAICSTEPRFYLQRERWQGKGPFCALSLLQGPSGPAGGMLPLFVSSFSCCSSSCSVVGTSDEPKCLSGLHACLESQEQDFHLAVGTASSGSAVSIWHWPKEGSVTTNVGTGKGTARESHGMEEAS